MLKNKKIGEESKILFLLILLIHNNRIGVKAFVEKVGFCTMFCYVQTCFAYCKQGLLGFANILLYHLAFAYDLKVQIISCSL